MTDEEKRQIIMSAKYSRIIQQLSEMYGVSLKDATDMFYNSTTMELINEGIADLHCRSDKYLAEEVWMEHSEQISSI